MLPGRRCAGGTPRRGPPPVTDGNRILSYLSRGSVGIGMVIDDYLTHRQDERFRQAADRIRTAALTRYYMRAGLFTGRSGRLLHLARRRNTEAARHVRDMAWNAVSYRGGLAFPGEGALRMSMDLGTGTAGVLLALGAALHDHPVHLPFLPAPKPPRETSRGRRRRTRQGGDTTMALLDMQGMNTLSSHNGEHEANFAAQSGLRSLLIKCG